jgi:hypothetical protein
VATFSLRSSVGGSGLPFAIGQVFRKGDVPSGQTLVLDTPAFQVTPISTWDDGSVKHALVAGKIDLTANTSKTVVISPGSASGTALSEADLIAANPSADVTYGGKSVSLAPLLGTAARVLTEHAGPQYAAFQYMASFPGDADLRAVFYVQLWAGGRYRVRLAVENGKALRSSATKSGSASVSIAGASRFSGSVSMPQGVRWDAVGFNGTDPQIVPTHNVQYLRQTKLVPNYGYTSPSSSALNGLNGNYQPMSLMAWESDMGAGGFQPPIGLLPHWDALYCTSGDSRAYNACIAMARGYGVYSVFYRDVSTKRMPKFSDYPSAVNDVDSQESMQGNSTNSYRWEIAHHPNAGYLAWLLSGERYFLEAIQATAWAAWFTDSGSGQGVNKLYSSQTRARAWRYRTIAAAAAVSPDGDPIKQDCKANIVANLNHWQSVHVSGSTPGTGIGAIYDDKEGGQAGFQHSIFETLFLVACIGWSSDMEMALSSADRSTLLSVRNYFYKVPVGLAGRGPSSSEYLWRRATGPYRMTIGSSASASSLYSTWLQVYNATYSDAPAGNTIVDSYADDNSAVAFPQGNWGHVITALAYAKDHGAPGAAEGYTRITGASNWNSNAVKYNDWPQYGVLSRT